jgi:hypothetical protein
LSTIADTGNCVKGEFGSVTKALPFSGMDVTGQQCMWWLKLPVGGIEKSSLSIKLTTNYVCWAGNGNCLSIWY